MRGIEKSPKKRDFSAFCKLTLCEILMYNVVIESFLILNRTA